MILVTANAANNFTFNVASTSAVALNTILATNQTVTIAILVNQGTTAYYCTGLQIDGVAQVSNTNLWWQGGTAPTAGNPSGYDVYTFAITKTASATYITLASLVRF